MKRLKPEDVIDIPKDLEKCDIEGKIFLRQAYLGLLEAFNDDTHPGVLLVGAPGVGKSCFGILALLKCLAEGKNVILKEKERTRLFNGGSVEHISDMQFQGMKTDKIILIADDSTDGLYNMIGKKKFAKILDIKSPNEKSINNSTKYTNKHPRFFANQFLTVHVLKPFSLDEITIAAEKLESDARRQALVIGNYGFAGGSYRNASRTNCKSYMIDGLNKLAGYTALNFSVSLSTNAELSHRVIHLFPPDGAEDSTYVLRFCSTWALNHYCDIRAQKDAKQLLRWANTVDIPGGYRGDVFENRMHYYFATSSSLNFITRTLCPSTPSKGDETAALKHGDTGGAKASTQSKGEEKTIKICSRFKFSKWDDLQVKEMQCGCFYWPSYRNLEAVDCFLLTKAEGKTVLYMFQDTVSKKHPVKAEGMRKIKKLFEKFDIDAYVLVFLTPPTTYVHYINEQKIKKSNGNDLQQTSPATRQEVWMMISTDDNALDWGEGEESPAAAAAVASKSPSL